MGTAPDPEQNPASRKLIAPVWHLLVILVILLAFSALGAYSRKVGTIVRPGSAGVAVLGQGVLFALFHGNQGPEVHGHRLRVRLSARFARPLSPQRPAWHDRARSTGWLVGLVAGHLMK